ncbi:MAG TPA: nitroreductase [Candidatus Paceibacterota bacterium]
MIINQDIRKILEAAIEAPSGENCQPWRFRISPDEIQLFNNPISDQSLYNWGQRGSYVACGAALENIAIAGSAIGYRIDLELFSDPSSQNFVAKIKLIKQTSEDEPLYSYIARRATNRKIYQPTPLTDSEITTLRSSAGNINSKHILLTCDPIKIKKLAIAGSGNERVMFNNQFLHNFFFSHINWNKSEDDKKKIGFYIKTLELPPPAKILFPIFRRWPIMSWLNRRLKLYQKIATQNAKTYASAPVFGIITADNSSPKSCVEAGRILERLWLTVTKLGLNLQPLTGVQFFMRRIEAGETDKFLPEQIQGIKKDYESIKEIFDLTDEVVLLMFRIGRAAPPTARASRYPLDKFIVT